MPTNDLFLAALAPEFFDGQDGNDTVSYQSSTGPVKVDLLNNTAVGGFSVGDTFSSIENVTGSNLIGAGDKLYGDAANNILLGLAGNDVLEGGAGADNINGGDGSDYASYTRSLAGVTVNLSTFIHTGGDALGDTLIGIESIIGSAHNDILTGTPGNNELFGGDGGDVLNGMGGNDIINGGAGFDYVVGSANLLSNLNLIDIEGIIGTASGDTLIGNNFDNDLQGLDGNDYLDGGAGNDTLNGGAHNDFLIGGLGADVLNGGLHTDTVRYLTSLAGVNINLATLAASGGDAEGDTLISIESVEGSNHADILIGSTDNNRIIAFNGADTINGGGGNDLVDGGAGADDITTGSGNDTIYGGTESDIIQAGDGNNFVIGDTGDDIITTGTGSDTIYGGSGIDTITSGIGDDTIDGGDDADSINAGDGKNVIWGGTGVDSITSGSGDDIIDGGVGSDIIDAGGGNDTIVGLSGSDSIDGGEGVDTVSYEGVGFSMNINLSAFAGVGIDILGNTLISIESVMASNFADTLRGSDVINKLAGSGGNDIIYGSLGADIMDGGEGWDYANYSFSASAIQINLETGIQTGGDAAGDMLIDIEAIVGSSHNDILIGDSENNYMRGGNGNDYLSGGHGWDKLLGQQGNDTYVFTSGFYTLSEEGTGFDRVIFDSFWSPDDILLKENVIGFKYSNNTITFNNINLFEAFSFDGHADMTLLDLKRLAGIDLTFVATIAPENFVGGDGYDTVDFSGSNAAVNVNLLTGVVSGGFAQGDHLISIENVKGSDNAAFRDTLIGDAYDNILEAQNGSDFLEGGLGADIINGGAGWDYARYNNSGAAININLTTGVHTGGDAAGDTLIDIEAVVGSSHDDVFRGSAGHDAFWGGAGADTIYGGIGQDQLYGEGGADTFVFEAATAFHQPDLLRDFKISDGDSIDISDLLVGYDPLTDAITDFVQITDNGAQSFLKIDVNGGADSFVQIATIYAVGLTDEEALESSGRLVTV